MEFHGNFDRMLINEKKFGAKSNITGLRIHSGN